jgi:hypothetical protein
MKGRGGAASTRKWDITDFSGTSKGGTASILKPHLQYLACRLIGLRGLCRCFHHHSRVDSCWDSFCTVVYAMVPFWELFVRADRSFVRSIIDWKLLLFNRSCLTSSAIHVNMGRTVKTYRMRKSYNETKQIYSVILFKPYLFQSNPIQSNKSSPMNFKIQSNLLFNPRTLMKASRPASSSSSMRRKAVVVACQ